MIVLVVLISAIFGGGIVYGLLSPKVKQVQKIDEDLLKQNEAVKSELAAMEQRTEYLKKSYQEKYEEYHKLREDCEKESREAETKAKNYYNKMLDILKQKFEYDLDKEKKKYEEAADDYRQEYASILFNAVGEFQKEISQRNAELAVLKDSLETERAVVLAAINANKRALELKEKENFYRLVLLDKDLEEIQELRKCSKNLRNPEPLNKVIWKVYYEKPYTDLVGRVVGSGTHTGIYKITNLKDGKCYVGQAADISSRFRQHIKRGLGAETPTRNKLYPAMLAEGVENFSFEVIEECDRSLLNEREDFWQEYFGAKEFGYSIK